MTYSPKAEPVVDVVSSKDVAKKSDIKNMATKTDIEGVKTAIAKLEARILRQQMVIAVLLLAGMALLKFI